MQKEGGVILNAVDDVEGFLRNIKEGKWHKVLLETANLRLPQKKVEILHEHIVLEMIEMREVEAARGLLHESEALGFLRDTDPEHYLELEKLCNRTIVDPKKLYGGKSKQKQRNEIAKQISTEIQAVPPSRLMVLIGQAIKWYVYVYYLQKYA